jgi:hypothetical protein
VLEQGGDDTAAWLAFVGALIVASLAAGTAQVRLRRQLRHDRELRDLEELRSLLDDCAQVIARAAAALIHIQEFLSPISAAGMAARRPICASSYG